MKKNYFALLFMAIFANTVMQAQNCSLLTNTNVYWPAPNLSKPGYRQTVNDPVFGTKITRITGNPGAAIPNLPGQTWGNISRHNYSKDVAWNADESLLHLKQIEGVGEIFLDGQTYQVLFQASITANETRWHPVNPNLMIFVRNKSVGHWNPTTGTVTTIATFSNYSNCYFGPWEGNPSNDGNWVVINAKRTTDNKKVCFAYDLKNKVKYADIVLTGIQVDWVSISALGNYIVINGKFTGNDDQTQVYNINGVKVGSLWSESGRPSHYDLTVDQNGYEVAVGSSRSGPDDGRVIKRRLTNGAITVLTQGGYASHTSARCVNRPGWAIVSYDYSGPDYPPYWNELVAVKLDGQRVERLCHTRTSAFTYDAESHGSVSPSGTRVVYASDWMNGDNPIQAYVVDFRTNCSGLLRKSTAPTGQIDLGTKINLFPNPASTEIKLTLKTDIPGVYNVEVINALGQSMYTQRINVNAGVSVFSIATDKFRPGTYFVNINSTNGSIQRHKLIIK